MPSQPQQPHHLCTVCSVPVTETGRHLWPELKPFRRVFGTGECAICGSVKHTTYLTVYRIWFCREHYAEAQALVHTKVPDPHRRLPGQFR